MLALQLTLQLIIYVAIGMFLEKKRLVGESFDQQLSVLFTDIILPCMIFRSLQLEFDPSDLKNCGILLLLALGYLAISLALGHLACRIFGGDWGKILRFSMVFTNFTLMGFPVVETLFGAHALFYFVVFLVPIRVIFYSAPHALLAPDTGEGHSQGWKGWFSPPLAAVLLGLVFYLFQWHLPQILSDVVAGLAATASPIGMILCGLVLGKRPLGRLVRLKYAVASVIRLLILPGIFYLLLLPLPVSQEIRQVVTACAMLPSASLTASFTLRHNPNPDAQFDAAGLVLISHLLSIATIPLWSAILA